MKTRELIAALPDTDARVLVTINSGPYRSPDKLAELIGTADVIMETAYPRTDVTSAGLRRALAAYDPDGDAQLFWRDSPVHASYYDVARVKTRHPGEQVVIVAGAFRTECG